MVAIRTRCIFSSSVAGVPINSFPLSARHDMVPVVKPARPKEIAPVLLKKFLRDGVSPNDFKGSIAIF
jgi:hypothetical protein